MLGFPFHGNSPENRVKLYGQTRIQQSPREQRENDHWYLRSVDPDCQLEYYFHQKVINWKKWWSLCKAEVVL